MPNMFEETIAAQKIVYNNVRKAGGEMIKMARNAHKLYEDDSKREQAFQSEEQKRLSAKTKVGNDLTKAVAEKKRMIEETKKKMKEIISKCDGEITALQEQIRN